MMFRSLFFISIGLYMIYQGHPGWGLFSCLMGTSYITAKKSDNNESILSITFNNEEKENVSEDKESNK